MSDISKTTSSSGVVHREDAETRIGAILKGSASCWEEAVQQYIEKHPKKSITFINKDEGIRDCEVKVAAQDIIGRYKESSEISKVGRFAKQLSQYCEILDLFCEQQPYQVAVVWGFFRFLIKVTAHEEEVRELIAEGLDQALRYINLGNNTLKSLARGQYQTPSVSNVQSSVVRLFSHTVYFLQEAWEYIGRKKLARLKQAIFSSFKAEFKSKLEGLKQEALDIITAMQWTTYETIQASTSVLRLEIQNPEGHTARSDIEEIHSSLANNGRDIDKATPETCDWVQNDPTYQQWRAEPHGILWLLGEMGSGKSVLTKYLAKSSTERPNFAFFFSRMRCPGDSTPELFVGCLLMYMMQNQKPARNAFPLPRQLDRKWDLIHKLLGEYKEFDIFIDGLDECTFQHEQAFEDWMLQLETLQRSSGVRIIISSRPHRGILAHAQRGMQLVLGGDGSKRDAVTFATKFIASNSSLSPFRESIMRTLSERPSYNILEIQMRLMAACRARTNTQALDCIQKLPSRLSEIYQEILDETELRIEKADYGIRREIFMLLFRQREPLTARHISAAYALKPMDKSLDSNDLLIDPANAILDICYPLVTIRDGYVSFTHVSIKEFLELHVRPSKIQEENLRLSNEESDKYFARKCLSVLLLEQYSSPRRIGMLLHRNLLQDVSRSSSPERFEDTDDFHQYAATNWVNHLTAIENPDHDILILANDFISTFSFVHWSEYVVKRDSDFAVPFRTRYRLMRWLSTLPDSSQDLVDTTKYFEGPYTTLSEHYSTEAKDRELQWLCLYRLARYFIQVDYKRAHRVLQQTVEGLTILLGPENPLTLLARTDYAKLLLGEGLMKEARDNFLEIWDIQREVSPDSVDAYTSLALAGLSSYYMTYFDISKQQQQQAYDGLAKRIGANHYDTLCSRLYLAYAKAGLGSDGLALDEFSEVYKARSEVHGRDDGLSIMSLAARGQSERILDRLESARDSIQQAWESRLRLWNLSHANVIDTAIHLLITYRDMGLQDEAQSIISRLNLDQIREQQYLRYCQITHIRGLLLYDEDEGDFGIGVLQNLLSDNKERARGNNRWLMWVRLSLAQMMTEHDEGHEVLGLFEGIIRKKQPDTEDLSHNGESPKLLELAMKVLSLVRKRMYSEAETCLRDENCEWVRESDLWIPVGGPAAETGLMRGPWIS